MTKGGGTVDRTLYHYTDFMALDGILRCAQLRVNNVLRMNDSAEMRHFMNGLLAAVETRLREGGSDKTAREVRQRFVAEMENEYSAFAACFSFRRDDAAQWERYGNGGRGVCIAFQGELLQRMAIEPLSLQTVFYQDDMSGHPMVERIYRLVERGVDLDGAEMRQAMREAWACSVAFKHSSFSSEDEMRLVVAPFEGGGFHVKPCYHIAKERIKKYYPLDLLDMCRKAGAGMEDLITEVIIGPESAQSLSILQDYLCDNGLGALSRRVSLSACPLRRLPT